MERLGPEALVLEALMTGMRTYSGVDLNRIRARWDVDIVSRNVDLIGRLERDGLVTIERDHLVPSLPGLALADSIAASLAGSDLTS